MNELLDTLNEVDDAPDILTELVYEYLGGWSVRDRHTGETVECGKVTWDEAAAKVLAAFTMKYAPPLVQLLTPEKIEEHLEEERQHLFRTAALEVVGYGQEMRLN